MHKPALACPGVLREGYVAPDPEMEQTILVCGQINP
tara:strand:- start:457 stop:564 length:108 start_codon:yes stop_codon:yes gene_type:complete